MESVVLSCSRCHTNGSNIDIALEGDMYLTIISTQQIYCLPCLDTLCNEQFADARIAQQKYIYFKEFQSSFTPNQNSKQQIVSEQQHDLSLLEAQQSAITDKLTKAREAQLLVKENIKNMEMEQQRFWQNMNRIQNRTTKLQELLFNARSDKEKEVKYLEGTTQTSVLHLFLKIQIDDHLALVQNMAMGRRPQIQELPWDQIVVGMGHLLLALNIMAVRYDYAYKRIAELRLKGSLSEIDVKNGKRLALNKEMREILEIVLSEVDGLAMHILQVENREYSEELKLPYAINCKEAKIVDLYIDPIKIQEKNRWNVWTKAMRYFLIDFNHLVTIYALSDKYL